MDFPSRLPAAVIFDMDGVLVDSNPYHLQTWGELLTEHGIPFDDGALLKYVVGMHEDITFHHFFGLELSTEDKQRLSDELEARLRKAFGPDAEPLPGLRGFVLECQASEIPMAVASSAVRAKVEFVMERLKLHPYMRALVTGDEVSHPKPDPEIYLKTVERLGLAPSSCVAFEDSFVGVDAAKRAGLKCVAIASTFPPEDLRQKTHADLILPGFEGLSLNHLRQLFS